MPQADGTLTAEEQVIADANKDAGVDTQSADEKAAADKAVADKAAADAAAQPPTPDPAIAEINSKIDKVAEQLKTLGEKTKDTSAEWTIEKLEAAELKCHAGEYDIKYLPKITTMKALLTARQVAAEERATYTKESTWDTVQARWDAGMQRAVDTFGEVGEDGKKTIDPASKLWKTAQAILHQDPGFRKVHELKARGLTASQIDPSLIDPDGQFKAFEVAHSRLSREASSAPNTSGKGGSRTALGGQSLPKGDESGVALLDKLEKRASDTGDPNDWIALDKERLKQDRVRRGQR